MKTLVCEMCNSTALVKDGDVFVCQHCGTKYSVEAAKKMMVEGTVTVDNSAYVEKYLANARRAKQKEDWAETEKYYNLVEQNDPTNIEAIFYSAYGKAKTSLVDSDLYKRQAAFKVLQKCISVLDDNFSLDKETENYEIIKQISNDVCAMAGSSYVYNTTKNLKGEQISNDSYETKKLFLALHEEFAETLENIVSKYTGTYAGEARKYNDLFALHYGFLYSHYGTQNYIEKLRKHAPSKAIELEIAKLEELKKEIKLSNGCWFSVLGFIAVSCAVVLCGIGAWVGGLLLFVAAVTLIVIGGTIGKNAQKRRSTDIDKKIAEKRAELDALNKE